MKIRVKLFASAREIVGQRELVMEVPDGTSGSDLLRRLIARHPRLAGIGSSVKLAVNHEYAPGERILADGDEIGLIPPVSGGRDLFDLTEAPLSLDAVSAAVAEPGSGAIASFLGIVRGVSRGRQVEYLEYDAYPEMAAAKLEEIGKEIRARWPVGRVAIRHRVGRLGIGEASVAIAVGAPHRAEALAACAYAIERLKQVVPIWKKEVWADGSEWIGSTVDEYRESHGG